MKRYDYYSKLVYDPGLQAHTPISTYETFPKDCSHSIISPLSDFEHLLDLFQYDQQIFEQTLEDITRT